MLSLMVMDACRHNKELVELGDFFPMFELLGEHTQGQCLNLGNRFLLTLSVQHDTWKIGHFSYPSPIVFSFRFNTD